MEPHPPTYARVNVVRMCLLAYVGVVCRCVCRSSFVVSSVYVCVCTVSVCLCSRQYINILIWKVIKNGLVLCKHIKVDRVVGGKGKRGMNAHGSARLRTARPARY